MLARPVKILAAATLAITLLAIVAYTDIFLYDYEEASGVCATVYAKVWGWAEQDAYGCLTGGLYGIGGGGDAKDIRCLDVFPWRDGPIIESTPSGDRAYVITTAYILGEDGYVYADAIAIASIRAVKGAC